MLAAYLSKVKTSFARRPPGQRLTGRAGRDYSKNMKFKILFGLFYYLLLAVLAAVILLFIGSAFPLFGNYKVFTVLSGSMEPAVRTGSVILVSPAEDYRIGDIITFGKFGKSNVPVTHRIAEIEVDQGEILYITKGDANAAPDARKVNRREVIGKTAVQIPYLGYLVNFIKKPAGFALIIILPAAAIIIDEVKNILAELKKRKPEGSEPKKSA